jgi:hypothetical protein
MRPITAKATKGATPQKRFFVMLPISCGCQVDRQWQENISYSGGRDGSLVMRHDKNEYRRLFLGNVQSTADTPELLGVSD